MKTTAKIVELSKSAEPISSEIMVITPDVAEQMLGKNQKNRTVSKGLVNAYARDMQTEDWRFTGEAIKFDKHGKLIDGQHRLRACVKAGKPFQTLVLRGLEPEAQEVLDSGRSRTAADALAINGHAGTFRLAASIRNLLFLKEGVCNLKVSSAEVLRTFERHPAMVESAHMSAKAFGMPQALVATIHYAGTHLLDKHEEANEFARVFITGSSTEGCPALVWRERLVRLKSGDQRVTKASMFYGSVHSWNLFCAGETLKMFRIPDYAIMVGLDVEKI